MNSIYRMTTRRTLLACLVIFTYTYSYKGLAAPSEDKAESGPIVSAPAGQVEGRVEAGLHVFKGIPYAEPPVGAERWTPPRPLPPWSGVHQATKFGFACAQPVRVIDSIYKDDVGTVSEDCLTLNIWAPADASNAPVFVWFHGGALTRGSSGLPFYNGSQLARQGIVVVSVNFRIGIFGYLAHPELSAESPLGISGNYGILDQVESLRWINKNIGAFGGDASNVTIAGESSGGLGVMYLMATPGARGLFAKAIAQSAYMVSSPELKQSVLGKPSAEDIGVQLAVKLDKPDLASLRATDAQTLADAVAASGYITEATIDGHVLPRQLTEIFDAGEQAPVPIIAGFNSGEIRSLRILSPPPPASAEVYEKTIRERYGDLADEFLRLYPSSDMQESIWATTRDALYGWTAEKLVMRQTALGQPSFLYLWDHGYPAADEMGLHAFHASELPYIFGTFDLVPPLWPKIPDTPRENRLSKAMIGYWTSFARKGQPVAENEPDWPAYGSTQSYMDFGDVPQPSQQLMPGMYELHEAAVCRRWASGKYPWNWNAGIISPPLVKDPEGRCP